MQEKQKRRALPFNVTPATLADLASINPMFHELEGLKIESVRARTKEDTHAEYDKSKWGELRDFASHHFDSLTIDDLDRHFLGNQPVVFSIGNQLYKGSAFAARKLSNQLVFDYLDAIENIETLVEIGAGYGSVLLGYQKHGIKSGYVRRFIGTDFSEAALALMEKIGEPRRTEVTLHDFSAPSDIIIPEKSVIISHMALMMIPKLSAQTIDTLLASKPRLVIHFETIWEGFTQDVLGESQKKYLNLCGYNW